MSLNGEHSPQVEPKRPFIEPIGPITLGKTDPKSLTKEQFQVSSGLLFHGASKPFTIDKSLDYSSFSGPYSQTLGNGLYLTDKFDEAAMVSVDRGNPLENSVVYSLLPYQAKMLDLRSRTDPQQNAHVPPELVAQWQAFVKQIQQEFFRQNPTENIIKRTLESLRAEPTEEVLGERKVLANIRSYQGALSARIAHLNRVVHTEESVNIRDIIGFDTNGAGNGALPSDFTKFMVSNGFDGMISLENGDHHSQGMIPSYVFYKLDNIGTYDMWQRNEAKVEAE